MAITKEAQKDFYTFGTLFSIVLLWFGIELLDCIVFSGWLDSFGIQPREIFGLLGILFTPFLHGGFGHVFSNAIPFLILGYIVLKADKKQFYLTTLAIIVLGGLGTWLLGRSGPHIGASGVVYGYFGYVMVRGFSEKKAKWMLLAIVVALFFGGMIWGVFPSVGAQGISWEGHLFGMLAGGWMGRVRAKKKSA